MISNETAGNVLPVKNHLNGSRVTLEGDDQPGQGETASEGKEKWSRGETGGF